MNNWERPTIRGERHHQRGKTPSFSSSLLDAIYHSIDESQGKEEEPRQKQYPGPLHRKTNNAADVEEEISSLRRANIVEKWRESYRNCSRSSRSRHMNSDSSSSTDSSLFSSSETESASKSTPKPSVLRVSTKAAHQAFLSEATPKHNEGSRFMRTKSRALKIYKDLKKVKQPISPGGKIANFLNSIFTSRNLKKHEGMEDWSSVRKSRSVKDSSTPFSPTSRSCLNRPPPPSRGKSKRSVRFCPVSIIVDEDCQPCGQKSIHDPYDPSLTSLPKINSHFLKKNIDSFRIYEEKKSRKYELRGFYEDDSDDDDDDSCTSSDLFELENIGIVGIGNGVHRKELPVYGTTNLKINQAIANGFVM